MILPFSTKINGKPTYFVEMILKGLYTEADIKQNLVFGLDVSKHVTSYALFVNEDKKKLHDRVSCIKPKLHTIREDKNNRWQPGTMIDFFINARTKNMFRFAPRIPLVSLQTIEIKTSFEFMTDYEIVIDGRSLSLDEQVDLAHYDGFNTLYDFYVYFKDGFQGKLIHWTDKRY